jgi:hypothetical protein
MVMMSVEAPPACIVESPVLSAFESDFSLLENDFPM